MGTGREGRERLQRKTGKRSSSPRTLEREPLWGAGARDRRATRAGGEVNAGEKQVSGNLREGRSRGSVRKETASRGIRRSGEEVKQWLGTSTSQMGDSEGEEGGLLQWLQEKRETVFFPSTGEKAPHR